MEEELLSVSQYFLYAGSFLLSVIISAYITEQVLRVTRKVKIYDIPDNTRKIHGVAIPSMGGIGIFIAYMTIGALFMFGSTIQWSILIASSMILFATGVYDDMMNMSPAKKLTFQLLASFLTVFFADVRIPSLFGLMGIGQIPYVEGLLLTTLLCTFFINVFNFIDGIDGLACTLSIVDTAVLAVLFAGMGHFTITCVLLSIAGGAAGLLRYNLAPAKIYMGDTGSMLIGFSIFIFSTVILKRIDFETSSPLLGVMHSQLAVFMLLMGVMFLPVFDGLRVFILRLVKKQSPMKADRLHLHYCLLDAGCTHTQAVCVLGCLNVLFIALAFLLRDMHPVITLSAMTVIACMTTLLVWKKRRKELPA